MRRRLDELPDTNLLSRSMVSRAFSVWGHMVLAQIIVTVPLAILFAMVMSASTP
jgi:ABC-type histidine transport system ATPase subunit